MQVADVMTAPVMTVRPCTPVEEAVKTMLEHSISGLLVVDAIGDLVGVVTEGDFLRRAETGTERRRGRWLQFLLGPGQLASDYTRTHGRLVGEVMTPDARSLTETATLEEAVDLMERHHIKRVPIVRGGKPVGIVCRSDLLKAFAAEVRDFKTDDSTDKAIEKRLKREIDAQSWTPRSSLHFAVKNGVVDISGVIFDQRERAALLVLAENVPGVKTVTEHLTWVEPMSGTVLTFDETSPNA